MRVLPIAALTGVLIAARIVVVAHERHAGAPVDWLNAQVIELRAIEYEFNPNYLRLLHGVPYWLHLVNTGKEGHDFTAPDLFAAVQVKNREALNDSGSSIFLHPGETTDIYFFAPNAGLFAPRCADHDWAGMTATIVID